jgi:hypothetical protein
VWVDFAVVALAQGQLVLAGFVVLVVGRHGLVDSVV